MQYKFTLDGPGIFPIYNDGKTPEERRQREDEIWWAAALEAADGDEVKAALMLPHRVAD